MGAANSKAQGSNAFIESSGFTQGAGNGMSKPTSMTPADSNADVYSDYSTLISQGAKFYTTDGTVCEKIIPGAAGVASLEDCPPMRIFDMFETAAKRHPEKPALYVERPAPPRGEKGSDAPSIPNEQWTCWTWQQYWDESRTAAKAIMAVGTAQHESVCLFGFNAPEWFMGAMAASMAGAKFVGIYPTDTDEQVAYKTNHSVARVAIVEDASKLKKFKAKLDECPTLKVIVMYGDEFADLKDEVLTRADGSKVELVNWKSFLTLAAREGIADSDLNERQKLIKPGHATGVIYTSGTTGNPKGVLLNHDNLVFEVTGVMRTLPQFCGEGQERILSYLPLSHV